MIKLGQKLKEERMSKGYSVEEVAKYTKIKPDFILSIEKSQYRKLPSQTYATGFVKNYIQFLGLPLKENMAIFRREFDENQRSVSVLPENFSNKRNYSSTFRIHHKLIVVLGLLLIGLFIVAYQFRFVFIPPPLSVEIPQDDQVINTTQITVKGSTAAQSNVEVDGEQVLVDKGGNFEKTIRVFEGENTIKIVSIHPYGKRSEMARKVIVKLD